MKTAIFIIILLSVIAIDTKVRCDTFCDTGVKYRIQYVVQPTSNKMIVTNETGNIIFIVAIDFNRDGNYTMLVFDTNGDGMADTQFTNGTATAEQVIKIYCHYMNLKIS